MITPEILPRNSPGVTPTCRACRSRSCRRCRRRVGRRRRRRRSRGRTARSTPARHAAARGAQGCGHDARPGCRRRRGHRADPDNRTVVNGDAAGRNRRTCRRRPRHASSPSDDKKALERAHKQEEAAKAAEATAMTQAVPGRPPHQGGAAGEAGGNRARAGEARRGGEPARGGTGEEAGRDRSETREGDRRSRGAVSKRRKPGTRADVAQKEQALRQRTMAQLVGLIVSEDDIFKKHIGRLLRSGAIPVSVIDDRPARDGAPPDLVIVDTRGDASSAMAGIERLRASAPGAGIFAIAQAADPDLILQSMRAGANEFFIWPPDRRNLPRRRPAHGGPAGNRAGRARRPRRRWCFSAPRAAPARRRWP